jgi:mono/diheme cytochrome c family protein
MRALRWPLLRAGVLCLLAIAGAAISGCHRIAPPTPLDQLNAQQARGHGVYRAHCGQCHYDREDGPLHGPSLLGVFKKPYLPSGAPANDERVSATILHGRNLMPAQPNMDPQDLDDLLAYLHTL